MILRYFAARLKPCPFKTSSNWATTRWRASLTVGARSHLISYAMQVTAGSVWAQLR